MKLIANATMACVLAGVVLSQDAVGQVTPTPPAKAKVWQDDPVEEEHLWFTCMKRPNVAVWDWEVEDGDGDTVADGTMAPASGGGFVYDDPGNGQGVLVYQNGQWIWTNTSPNTNSGHLEPVSTGIAVGMLGLLATVAGIGLSRRTKDLGSRSLRAST